MKGSLYDSLWKVNKNRKPKFYQEKSLETSAFLHRKYIQNADLGGKITHRCLAGMYKTNSAIARKFSSCRINDPVAFVWKL